MHPVFSKIFEKLSPNQLLVFFENILSKFQCGFRKGYGMKSCLLMMFKSWKDATDKNKAIGAFLTDLLEAFDCLGNNY